MEIVYKLALSSSVSNPCQFKNHSDLGFHGGLLDDAVMDLIELGVVNGSRKEIDRGEHIIGMALGSENVELVSS